MYIYIYVYIYIYIHILSGRPLEQSSGGPLVFATIVLHALTMALTMMIIIMVRNKLHNRLLDGLSLLHRQTRVIEKTLTLMT